MTVQSILPILMGAPPSGGAAGGPSSIAPTLITFGLVFLIFYFLIIRPQNKKQKDTKAMLASLQKGDRVVSIGGIRGTIQSLKEDTVVIKVDTNTTLEFNRSAVAAVVERKGSGKSKARDVTPDEDAGEESSDE